MNKESFINVLPLQLKNLITNPNGSSSMEGLSSDQASCSCAAQSKPFEQKVEQFVVSKLLEQKGIIFTDVNDIQLKLFDVDSTLSPPEFDKLAGRLNPHNRIVLCEKVKLIYGFNSLTPFIIRLIDILGFSTFFSIFDITSNIKLYGFYSLNYTNPVEILVKQIRHDLFIVKSFKEFTIQEMKKEHDFHLPYKEFKRLNLNDGNLVVVKILFKNEQKPIDLSLIKTLLPRIELLHLSLESESKLKPFNDLIDQYGKQLKYLKFGVNRGTFKKIPVKNSIKTVKLVNIDNLSFINDLKDCQSLDVFFDNWELRKNCDIKFQQNFIIDFDVSQRIESLKTLNIFHTYLDSKDLNKLKFFPNLTYSKISYVILDKNGFDMSECKKLQELKIHFTYHKTSGDLEESNTSGTNTGEDINSEIQWPPNAKKLSITIHNIKNLVQNFSIRLNILKKIAKPLPPSIVDLCIDISYDTGGSGPELYSISRDDILKISTLINKILTNKLENLKLKGISRYNYKIGKPLIFSAINFPQSLKLLSLNDFILDYNFINLPNLKKLYFEHSLFDSDFRLPDSDEILIEKCTFKDLGHIPSNSSRIEFKMCTFRKVPTYSGDVSNVVINNCRVMEQPTNNVFQFQQQLHMRNDGRSMSSQGQNRNQQRILQSKGNGEQHIIGGTHRGGSSFGMKPFTSNSTFSPNSSSIPAGGMPNSFGKQQRFGDAQTNLYQDNNMEIQHGSRQPLPAIFTPDFGSQNLQLEPQTIQPGTIPQHPMLTSTSLGGLRNSDPACVSQMKPSSSVNQLLPAQPQDYGMVNYNYLGNTSQLTNFVESNLDARFNNLSLSSSYQYAGNNSPTGNGNIGRNTQERRISSPPLGSYSMTPSNSSTQQSQNGMVSNSRQNSRMSYSRLINQFDHNATVPTNGGSSSNTGYGLLTPSFGSTYKSQGENVFGYFKKEYNDYSPSCSPAVMPLMQTTQDVFDDEQPFIGVNDRNSSSKMHEETGHSDSSRISNDF